MSDSIEEELMRLTAAAIWAQRGSLISCVVLQMCRITTQVSEIWPMELRDTHSGQFAPPPPLRIAPTKVLEHSPEGFTP